MGLLFFVIAKTYYSSPPILNNVIKSQTHYLPSPPPHVYFGQYGADPMTFKIAKRKLQIDS